MSSHDAQGKSARWQYSLLGLMAATTLVCVGLAVLRLGLIPLDRRAAAIVITAIVLFATRGGATRGAALGAIGGLCIGLSRFEPSRIPIADELMTLAAAGACGAWFGAAFQAAKRGHETIGLLALFLFFVWFTFWFCS